MDYYKISLIITIVFVLIFTILNFYGFLLFLDKKHLSSKYCNECNSIFNDDCIYCSFCGKELDDEYVIDADLGDNLRTHILAYKKLFKKRDIVYFEDYDCNYIDISICLLNKEDRRYLKELQNNEKFLNMIVKNHTIKRVRDGFMKSHLEHTIIYSSGDKKNIYDDYANDVFNGGIDND